MKNLRMIPIACLVCGSFLAFLSMAGEGGRKTENLVPADKELTQETMQRLYERGEQESYSGSDLDTIGMPVGGIGAGHMYLGGDGHLWLWEIFNKSYARGFLGKGAGGETFLHPFEQIHPFP